MTRRPNFAIPGLRTFPMSERIPAPPEDPAITQMRENDPAAYAVWTAQEAERKRKVLDNLLWGNRKP